MLISLAACGVAPAEPTSAPANPLIGRWQVLSIGKKTLPSDAIVVWTIDKQIVTVTLNDELRTQSTYVLRPADQHPTIELTEKGKSAPDRIGWYEKKDGRLRLQLTLPNHKPLDGWDDNQVIVLQPLAD